jgi:ketosteroid isomerase-like protein
MKRLVLPLLVLAFATIARAGDEETILKLDRENTVATWTGDARWFEQHLADDFVSVTANGKVKTKDQVVHEFAAPGFSMEPYEPTEVQVRVYGDTAIVTGRVYQRFSRGGMRYEIDARYTDVYSRRRGRWMLVTAHASPVLKKR